MNDKLDKTIIEAPEEGERLYLNNFTVPQICELLLIGKFKAREIQGSYNESHNAELRIFMAIAIDECKKRGVSPLQSSPVRGLLNMMNSMLPDELQDKPHKDMMLLDSFHRMRSNMQQAEIGFDKERFAIDIKKDILNGLKADFSKVMDFVDSVKKEREGKY